jgi:hypothetical protein
LEKRLLCLGLIVLRFLIIYNPENDERANRRDREYYRRPFRNADDKAVDKDTPVVHISPSSHSPKFFFIIKFLYPYFYSRLSNQAQQLEKKTSRGGG